MDADRFETFLRSLSAAPSRRRATQLLAGLVLGSLAPLTALESEAHNAVKRCKKLKDKAKRRKCLKRAKQHTASHNAQDGTTLPFSCAGQANSTPCGPGPSNQCCGGICVDTATDEVHCGTCNGPCEEIAHSCCAGNCVRTSTTSAHCGGCGNACLPDEICASSSCCTAIGTVCQPADDRCCAGGTCSGVNGQGESVCCGVTGVAPCFQLPGCRGNSLCLGCCSSYCGAAGVCDACVQSGSTCPMGCTAGQACAACCSGQCSGTGHCCHQTGAKCTMANECCSGSCQPSGQGFSACT